MCSNGFDDDFDGLIDFTPPAGETADPDCSSAADLGEQGDPLPECSNGFDDDGDGLIDFTPPVGETADPDCSSAADLGEQGDPLPECSNGFDDDGDDKVDFTPPGGETADPGCSSAADLDEGSEGLPPGEDTNPAAVGDSALAGFPTSGATYAILSSGNTNFADDPNNSSGTSQSNGNGPGSAAHGDNVRDLVQLKVDLNVPAGRNCLSLDFRFLSEEFPEYVGSAFNDGFVAELDTSDFQATSDAITAPNNFAFDSLGDVISINTTGASGFSEAEAAGTTYDGATPRLRARTPITPGAHSVYLSVFDVGDSALDSAAFVDELVLYSAPAGSCVSGSTADLVPPAVTLVNPADGSTTTDSTPTYDGSAGTAAGDSTTVTVKIYAGATATGSPVQTLTTTQSGGSWTVDGSPALGDGTYTAQAEQSDSAGNTGQSAPPPSPSTPRPTRSSTRPRTGRPATPPRASPSTPPRRARPSNARSTRGPPASAPARARARPTRRRARWPTAPTPSGCGRPTRTARRTRTQALRPRRSP